MTTDCLSHMSTMSYVTKSEKQHWKTFVQHGTLNVPYV